MSLQKVTYVSQQSVISAENLNNIQDAIIDLESSGGGGGSVFELASLTTAAMPSYEVAHNSNTIIHYQDYYYTSAGETGDGVDSWCIQYQCVTSVASAGNKMAASWLLLQYHPVTKVATYISLSFGTINGAVDSALSTTSTNAVQNKVITNALNGLNAEVTSLSELIGDYVVFGTIDNQNAISLDGNLVDGTYSVKYCKPDGSSIIVGSFTLGGSSYTNVLVPASATLNVRWSNTSGGFTTSGGTGYFASDYIDIGTAQKLYFSGCQWVNNANITYYNASKSILQASDASSTGYGASPYTQTAVTEGNNSYILLKYKNDVVESIWNDAKYIRVGMKVSDSAIATADLSEVVLTLDEEIA